MGIALLFVSVLFLTYCMIFLPSGSAKHLWVAVGILIFALIAGSLILNDANHFGMKQVTETTQQTLYSSTPGGKKEIIYHSLGNGQEKIYYYRTGPNQKKLYQTNPATTTVTVKRNHTDRLTVQKKFWVYHSGFAKFYFAGGQPDHQLISQRLTFHLQKSWQVVEK